MQHPEQSTQIAESFLFVRFLKRGFQWSTPRHHKNNAIAFYKQTLILINLDDTDQQDGSDSLCSPVSSIDEYHPIVQQHKSPKHQNLVPLMMKILPSQCPIIPPSSWSTRESKSQAKTLKRGPIILQLWVKESIKNTTSTFCYITYRTLVLKQRKRDFGYNVFL